MTEPASISAVRFGRTIVLAATGDLIDQPVQAIVYAANSRGVMGAGPAGSVRMAGGLDIEREVMALAPLDLGAAVVTGSSKLAERGIEAVIHAVVAPTLGDAARIPVVRRALAAALRLADASRYHAIGLPLLGVRADEPLAERRETIEAIVDELVAYLRRGGTRLESVVIGARFEDDVVVIVDVLTRARQRSWPSPP